jgi:hypothetical protein
MGRRAARHLGGARGGGGWTRRWPKAVGYMEELTVEEANGIGCFVGLRWRCDGLRQARLNGDP